MLRIKTQNSEFTMPRKNVVMLALQQAMSKGLTHGKIHDEESAIEYLESIGIEVYGKTN